MSRRFILRFIETLLRHRWLHLFPVVGLTLLAIPFLLTPVYLSHATIYLQRDNLLETLTAIRLRDTAFGGVTVVSLAQITASEFQALASTDAFASAVIAETDLRDQLNGSPREVEQVLNLYRESLTVAIPADNLIRLQIEAERPELAYQLTMATLNAYRAWNINRSIVEGQIAQTFFAELIEPYQRDLAAARDAQRRYLQLYPDPAVGNRPVEEVLELTRLQNEVTLLEMRLQDIQDKAEQARLAELQTDRDIDQTYRIIDLPVVPPAPEPIVARLLLSTIFPLAGLLVMMMFVFLRMAFDRTLLFRIDVYEELALPVLTEVPTARQHLVPAPHIRGRTTPSTPIDDPLTRIATS